DAEPLSELPKLALGLVEAGLELPIVDRNGGLQLAEVQRGHGYSSGVRARARRVSADNRPTIRARSHRHGRPSTPESPRSMPYSECRSHSTSAQRVRISG